MKEELIEHQNPLAMDSSRPKKILIIGCDLSLARLLVIKIVNKYPGAIIIGTGKSKQADLPSYRQVSYVQIPYKYGHYKNLFDQHQFDVVYQLARPSLAQRQNQNSLQDQLNLEALNGQQMIELAHRYHCKKFILLSTFHIYGSSSEHQVFLNEESPLKADLKYLELREVVQIDQMANRLLFQLQREMSIVILRPCHIIGHHLHNTITKYLLSNRIIYPNDYNPAFQFLDEDTMVHFLIAALEKLPLGTYNIAPDDFVHFDMILKLRPKTKKMKSLSMPFSLLGPLQRLIDTKHFLPSYMISYLEYTTLLSNRKLKKQLKLDSLNFSSQSALCKLYAKV